MGGIIKKKALISFLLIVSLFVGVPAWAQDGDELDSALGFLSGDYILIGRKIDSDETYTGRISFVYNETSRCLDLKRTIGGQTVTGTARIVPVLEGDAQVLRLSFWEKGVEYEGTFLWRGDLDNFGRLSGFIYAKGTFPDKPGLEAYFIDQR
jgi:hypothetical protein